MKLLGQLGIVLLGLGAIVGTAFALRGVFPAFFGIFRLLANPIVVAGAVVLVVLMRLRPRTAPSGRGSEQGSE